MQAVPADVYHLAGRGISPALAASEQQTGSQLSTKINPITRTTTPPSEAEGATASTFWAHPSPLFEFACSIRRSFNARPYKLPIRHRYATSGMISVFRRLSVFFRPQS